MEGVDGVDGVDELLLAGGHALPDLDRRAIASHCAAVANHMSAIARLFDPLCAKAAPDGRKHKKGAAGALALRAAACARRVRADEMQCAAFAQAATTTKRRPSRSVSSPRTTCSSRCVPAARSPPAMRAR